jgi:pleiotropic regulator 1
VQLLTGHGHTIGNVATQEYEPQVIAAGKCLNTLTNHKKSVKALLVHPSEYTFASAAIDNIKFWKCPQSEFLKNIPGHNSIIDSIAVILCVIQINHENLLVSGGNDGALKLWDWK